MGKILWLWTMKTSRDATGGWSGCNYRSDGDSFDRYASHVTCPSGRVCYKIKTRCRLRQETEKQSEAFDRSRKKGRKVVYWDAGGSAKEWEQLFGKFRLKYPFLRGEHWRASDTEV
jgi:hypothetical protein